MTRLVLLGALALAACESPPPAEPAASQPVAAPQSDAPLAVTDAYMPPAPQGGSGALFLTVTGGPEADTLRAVSFSGATRAEIHETYDAGDGMRGMRPLPAGVPVIARSETVLAPGSMHVMLLGLTAPLTPGDTLDAVATFARAGAVPVRAVVRALDDMPAS